MEQRWSSDGVTGAVTGSGTGGDPQVIPPLHSPWHGRRALWSSGSSGHREGAPAEGPAQGTDAMEGLEHRCDEERLRELWAEGETEGNSSIHTNISREARRMCRTHFGDAR